MSEMEKDSQTNRPPIEFVYEEEDVDAAGKESEIKPDTTRLSDFAKRHIGTVLLGVLGILVGLCIGLFMNQKGEQTDETGGITDETAEGSGDTGAVETEDEYGQNLRQYLQALYGSGIAVEQEHGNGQYALETYIISDLDGDGMYPEALGLMWDEQLGRYVLEIYCYASDGTESIRLLENTLEEWESEGRTVEGLLLNRMEENNCVDIILIGKSGTGNFFSEFYRCAVEECRSMGTIDGIPIVQKRWQENGQVRTVYDMDGVYQIEKEYTDESIGISELRAVQEWKADAYGEMKMRVSVLDETWKSGEGTVRDYWKLEGMPVWYMKDSIWAYGLDTRWFSWHTLDGSWLRIVGVLETDTERYYQVETDIGETGMLIFSGDGSLDSCEIEPQAMLFLELFSETEMEEKPESDSWEHTEEDMSDLVVEETITAPVQIVLEENRSGCKVWCDLDGDGIKNEIYLKKEIKEDAVEISLFDGDGEVMLKDHPYKDGELSLLVVDLDETDKYMEIGFSYQLNEFVTLTELYQIDSAASWSLGLLNALSLSGVPQWFSVDTGEPAWHDGKVAVRSIMNGVGRYIYYIFYDALDGFYQEDTVECWLETPLSITVNEEQPLYDSIDTDAAVGMVEAGDIVTFDSFYYCYIDESKTYYRAHFICDNGTSGYLAPMYMGELMEKFNMEDFFGNAIPG